MCGSICALECTHTHVHMKAWSLLMLGIIVDHLSVLGIVTLWLSLKLRAPQYGFLSCWIVLRNLLSVYFNHGTISSVPRMALF